MGGLRRTHGCGEVGTGLVDQEVVVAGWVHGHRDHGGVIFADLRDRTGLLQVVFRPDASPEVHQRADELRTEFVIIARGRVMRREEGNVNPELPTGEVEVEASELRVLNSAVPPPFPIEEEAGVDESIRLRHRIHDLRRPPLQRTLEMRSRLAQVFRRSLCELGFLEIETPILAKATPEGARDFLVPSRLQPGEFYALPQSPQIMKQLFMISGFDRYFQIARCFRDEDQRADRQLEFTQVDLEMSFVGVDDVLEVLEEVTWQACKEGGGVELPRPFPRMGYAEAMARYGVDRPDTRIQLELIELTELFRTSEFRAFRGVVDGGGIVKCLPVHDADELSRGDIDRLESFVKKELGARGLAWIRVTGDGTWQSPIVKFLSDAEREAIQAASEARPGSLLFFQADSAARANAILARLRVDLGQRLGRMDGRPWDPLFVVDFPLFLSEEPGELTYMHMPFVAPMDEDLPLLDSEPERVRATHYDVVLNGVELGSGSLRNHRAEVQRRILDLLGYSKEEMEARFGFLLNALDAGAPPHGGFAFGYDRLVMVLSGAESLRDVVAFPKTQRGQDLLMDAPSPIDRDQLEELRLRIVRERKGQ
ncbi:MAG: aspartate--tRNA ligase [Deltaproteobacteria bacterium]|jgi:aspartyl-tRNA synthetase|nr:aspartate--tRNA ligase [Deltaproteobacteria bacterium]